MFRARNCALLAISMGYSTALAGSGQLNVHAGAGLYDPLNLSSYTEQSLDFSGTGAFGGISTLASVSGAGESIDVTQEAWANISGETSGSIRLREGWTTVGGAVQGFANTSPTTSSVFPWLSTYNFTTSVSGTLVVSYDSSFTATDTIGFGLWNAWVYVDGTVYQPATVWVSPIPHGSWNIDLAPGAHTLGVQGFSNISGGVPTDTLSLDQTISFGMSAVPEPATIVGLGFLLLTCKARRRRV